MSNFRIGVDFKWILVFLALATVLLQMVTATTSDRPSSGQVKMGRGPFGLVALPKPYGNTTAAVRFRSNEKPRREEPTIRIPLLVLQTSIFYVLRDVLAHGPSPFDLVQYWHRASNGVNVSTTIATRYVPPHLAWIRLSPVTVLQNWAPLRKTGSSGNGSANDVPLDSIGYAGMRELRVSVYAVTTETVIRALTDTTRSHPKARVNGATITPDVGDGASTCATTSLVTVSNTSLSKVIRYDFAKMVVTDKASPIATRYANHESTKHEVITTFGQCVYRCIRVRCLYHHTSRKHLTLPA